MTFQRKSYLLLTSHCILPLLTWRRPLRESLGKAIQQVVWWLESGVHHDSVLSPLLFILVLMALSCEFHIRVPWELLYADDLAEIADLLE